MNETTKEKVSTTSLDTRPLWNKKFLVSVKSDGGKAISTRYLRGPFSYPEMLDAINYIYKEIQLLPVVIVASTDFTQPVQTLSSQDIEELFLNYERFVEEYSIEVSFGETEIKLEERWK
jgi:hypothetical protein